MTIVVRLLVALLIAAFGVTSRSPLPGITIDDGPQTTAQYRPSGRPSSVVRRPEPGTGFRQAEPGTASPQITLTQQPPPQPESGETGSSSAALRLLVVLLCGVGLSSVALGVAIAFKRRMSAISPDPDDDK